jgi:hypothetical protein
LDVNLGSGLEIQISSSMQAISSTYNDHIEVYLICSYRAQS